MPIVTALCGLVIGFIVGMAVEQRRHRVSFNEPRGVAWGATKEEWLTSPKGVTQFFEAVSFKDKYKEATNVTDVLNG